MLKIYMLVKPIYVFGICVANYVYTACAQERSHVFPYINTMYTIHPQQQRNTQGMSTSEVCIRSFTNLPGCCPYCCILYATERSSAVYINCNSM